MVCPYCSADIEPIELKGKIFCSNCGLTIANNTNNTEEVPPVLSDKINDISTEEADEIPFSVSTQPATEPEILTQEKTDEYNMTESLPRKLEVITEEPTPVTTSFNPITEEAIKDLGINDTFQTPEEIVDKTEETINETPIFESKISELSIPSEEDFGSQIADESPEISSYIELANPGNEIDSLEASGILLDILGENKNIEKTEELPINVNKKEEETPQNVEPVEIPEKTETDAEDDIYALPTDIKVGLTKKVKKEKLQKAVNHRVKKETDVKLEEKIEKIEQKIAEAPEPVVDLSPSEATNYDPDTIDLHDIKPNEEKAKIIKEYFSTAIDKDKKTIKTKKNKKKKQKKLKKLLIFLSVLSSITILSLASLYGYNYFIKNTKAVKVQPSFNTLSPTYVPEGYILKKSNYSDETRTFVLNYTFLGDSKNTITFKQLRVENSAEFVKNYLSSKNTNYIEKTVNNTTFTEVGITNLLWAKDGFEFIIETENYTLSNELLYKMAESVK